MAGKNVLIDFMHGLGDSVQLTIVLQHLRRHRPDWNLFLRALRGKHSVGFGYCERVWHEQEEQPDPKFFHKTYKLDWWECYSTFTDSPSTKACNCLREIFGIKPDRDLLEYRVAVSDDVTNRVRAYLDTLNTGLDESGRYRVVLIHYQGNTSQSKKNLEHFVAAQACAAVYSMGYVPMILDWDSRSPLPDGRKIICPPRGAGDIWGGFGSGDAETIVALAEQCALCVGIDSGPQKAFMASGTPTIGVWTKHMPVQFADLSPSTVHLVPDNWATVPPCHDRKAATYFVENYEFKTYLVSDLCQSLRELIEERLGGVVEKEEGLVKTAGWWVDAKKRSQDWVIINDIYVADAYRTHLIPRRDGPETVVDIGAHIGVFARMWHERNPEAKIICAEVNEMNLRALRKNVEEFAVIVPRACTYEDEVYLLDAHGPAGVSTGGSRVVKLGDLRKEKSPQYVKRENALSTVTLHEIMADNDISIIDLLKLDCEGSEFSILEHAPLEKIRFIVGEYHGFKRWEEFRARVFADGWDYGHMSRHGEFGNFHLRNRALMHVR